MNCYNKRYLEEKVELLELFIHKHCKGSFKSIENLLSKLNLIVNKRLVFKEPIIHNNMKVLGLVETDNFVYIKYILNNKEYCGYTVDFDLIKEIIKITDKWELLNSTITE